jgi:hypothetical protein
MKIAPNSPFSPVKHAVADTARRFLASPFRLLGLSTVTLCIGLYFGWSWLAAAGVLPLLLPALLCLGMCMLAFCMDMGSDAQSHQAYARGKASSPEGATATLSGVSTTSDGSVSTPSAKGAGGDASQPSCPEEPQTLLPSWLKRPTQQGHKVDEGTRGSA